LRTATKDDYQEIQHAAAGALAKLNAKH